MSKVRYIVFVIIFAILAGSQSGKLYAQVEGSPLNDRNAVDYRYQRFETALPQFPDSVRFRDRFYTTFGAGIEANWERSKSLNTSLFNFTYKATAGYMFTPVHAIEGDFLFSNVKGNPYYGFNVNYAANLTNITTLDGAHNRMETILLSGVSFRYGEKNPLFGFNTGVRFQYNVGINCGFFVEPRLAILADLASARKFTSIPSLNIGMTLRFKKPEYYLWDYLTPFAIKTNLLYDAVSALNIAIEAPIGQKWSVVAEWLSPWWSSYDKQIYLQLMQGGIEGRYWFGDRTKKRQLTGWFAGVSVAGGVYDLMVDPSSGFQGEHQIYSFTGGYAHPIDKTGNLRLEYSLGLGIMHTEYVKYWWDGFDYTLIAPSPQTWVTNWYGPTKLQVSLVYYLKIRSKVGGRE